jgi:hypothetical protein
VGRRRGFVDGECADLLAEAATVKLRDLKPTILGFLLSAVPALGGDLIVDWNAAALQAIRAGNTPPPMAARNLAILHASMYDAVNGIERTHTHYFATGDVPASASPEAAAAAAAHSVLSSLYPGLRATFDALYVRSMAGVRDGPQKDHGSEWGRFVAQSTLAWRSSDGSDRIVNYSPGTEPGQWRPTVSFGGVVRAALLPQWGSVLPFGIPSASYYLPQPPPALTSAVYTNDFAMVKDLGPASGGSRTPEQTQIAEFWSYGPNTATPAGHWNQIAQAVAESRKNTLAENARMFALLNIAMADAAIVAWDCKYAFSFWRPITAIREAAADGNSDTAPDPSWAPLLPTPPFPEYISGHSAFSGAAAVALGYFFGTDAVPFTIGSDDLPGVLRTYQRFSDAALESGVSRIYGGIHFMSANQKGLAAGAAVGQYACANLLTPKGSRSREK